MDVLRVKKWQLEYLNAIKTLVNYKNRTEENEAIKTLTQTHLTSLIDIQNRYRTTSTSRSCQK